MSVFTLDSKPIEQCFCVGPQGNNTKCPCELQRESSKQQCEIGYYLGNALRNGATKINNGRRVGDKSC